MQLKYSGNITYADFLVISETEKPVLGQQLINLNSEINADLLFLASVEKSGINAKTAVAMSNGQVIENFSYALKGSPCEEVLENEVCCFPSDVAELYPEDIALVEMNIEAYLGVPILNDESKPIGILVGLYFSSKPDLHKLRVKFNTFAKYLAAFLQKSFIEKKAQLQITLTNEIEELSNVGAWEYQVETNELYWSQQVYKIHGISTSAELSISNVFDHYEEEDKQRLSGLFETAIKNGEGYCEELRFIDADGIKKWVRASAKVEKNDEGKVTRIYGAFEDISTEKAILASEKEKTNRLNNIINNLNDALVIADQDGIIIQVNSAAKRIFECGSDDILGLHIDSLFDDTKYFLESAYVQGDTKMSKAKLDMLPVQVAARRASGAVFQIELSVTQAFENGQLQIISVIRDISEKIRAQDTIYNLAYTDSITGLKNKTWFEKEYGSLFKSKSKQEAYIYAAILDIDKLSQFNLKFGMKTGNLALKEVAKKLSSTLHKSCQIYKNGVDSFLILSIHSVQDLASIQSLKSTIERQLLEHENFVVNIKEKSIAMSASLGSAILDTKDYTFETFLDTLEYAIAQAKLTTPFGYYFADKEALTRYYRKKLIQSSLTQISSSNGFRLVLQPQYDRLGRVNSSEALLRWYTPDLENVSPLEFIEIAEQSGSIIELGNWVLEEVCQILHDLNLQGIKTCIAVNISVKQIVSPDFTPNLMGTIEKWQISPNQLILELTETTLVSDMELVQSVMFELNRNGFRFSIDDFGTGYSSLSYLKDLPIAELKIDKSFVDIIADSANHPGYPIIDMIIGMANALGVNSVAEGVEYTQQFEYLKEKGCDVFQGYLFSKPLEVAEWQKIFVKEG